MKQLCTVFLLLPILTVFSLFADGPAPSSESFAWRFEGTGIRTRISREPDVRAVSFEMPGSALIYRQANRMQFRCSREIFNAREISFQVRLTGTDFPLKAWIFCKDKDGAWYQTEEEYSLKPNEWTVVSARLDVRGRVFLPQGHTNAWNAQAAAGMFEAGLSVYGEGRGRAEVELKGPFFTGKRDRPPLRVEEWTLPDGIRRNGMFESRFQISREYFNPFDPEEIQADFEVELSVAGISAETLFPFLKYAADPAAVPRMQPETAIDPKQPKNVLRYPAFYSREFTISRHFTREFLNPAGVDCWAFRMTPFSAGRHRVRLRLLDRTGTRPEEYTTPWREFEASESDLPGYVRVNPANPHYFRFSEGKPYFPVSLNIHTNTDRRSEQSFRWGELPDRGLADFEEYFRACGKAGINWIEIWMASWTLAPEWSAARRGYYGVGRYNLENAWKLDRIFRLAEQYGIRINLVLAPHGMMSKRNDQEWGDNPYNTKNDFAVSNGAILDDPNGYWQDLRALRENFKRSRHIAARWGANPYRFAFELWSEVDLVENGRGNFDSGFLQFWHRNTARDLAAMSQVPPLLATHVCGDSGNVLAYAALTIGTPEFTHVCGDAYRNAHIPFVDQLIKHETQLAGIDKPLLTTEFGNPIGGGNLPFLRGEVHSALWASFFLNQAGSPALWWHDAIHFNNLYFHYTAFRDFIADLDPSLPGTVFQKFRADPPPFLPKACHFIPEWQAFTMTQSNSRTAGWIFRPETMSQLVLPGEENAPLPLHNRTVTLQIPLNPGRYFVRFFDTFTAECVYAEFVTLRNPDGVTLRLPPLLHDIAFQIVPDPGGFFQ